MAGYTENLNKEGKVTGAPPLEKVVEEFGHLGACPPKILEF